MKSHGWEGKKKKKKERGKRVVAVSSQTLSLSDPSHLSYQQSSDSTCIFSAEMRLKSPVHYPCVACVICISLLLSVGASAKKRVKEKDQRRRRRLDPTPPERPGLLSVRHSPKPTSDLTLGILFHPSLYCLTPSFCASCPLSATFSSSLCNLRSCSKLLCISCL